MTMPPAITSPDLTIEPEADKPHGGWPSYVCWACEESIDTTTDADLVARFKADHQNCVYEEGAGRDIYLDHELGLFRLR